MVDLWKELERRKAKRLGKARAIVHNQPAIAIMVICFGLSAFFASKSFDLQAYGSTERLLLGLTAPLLVLVQLVLVGVLWWARRVVSRDQRKL